MSHQFLLDIHGELVIDNFAGGGGASTGIFMALGRHVDHAINHDRHALGMHRINHPQTVHHCEDVFDVDPLTVCEGRPVGLAWFSPDCKHFSKAKGGKPLSKKIRGLILVMLRWAKYKCRVMCMENVEEIQTWGPLIEVEKNGVLGWYPDPYQKGRTWNAFLACLSTGIAADHPDLPEILEVLAGTVTKEELVRGFGYVYEFDEIRAFKKGAPTVRNRLFMVARRDGKPIVWPADTHADPKTIMAGSKLKPWRTIAECIDFSLPCPSIFLNKEQARKARCKRPLVAATLRRVAKGVDRYVLKAARPFIVSLTHQGGGRVEGVDDPSMTITGAHRGEKALCQPTFVAGSIVGAGGPEYGGKPIGIERPFKAQTTDNHSGFAAATLVQTGYGEREGQAPRALDIEKPVGAIVGTGKHAVIQSTLAPFVTEHAHASNQRNMPPGEPMRTQCAGVKGGHFAVVSGTLVHTAHGEQDANGKKRGRGEHELTGEPMPTVTASPDCAFAAVNMVKLRGTNVGNPVTHPMDTASAGGLHHGLVACYMAQHNGGFNDTPGHPVSEPVSTISATGSQQNLVALSAVRHFGESIGQEVDSLAPTVMPGGAGKTGIIAASCAAYFKSEKDGQAVSTPARTSTTKARMGEVESTLACPPLTPEQRAGALRVAAFLREYGVDFKGEYATVGQYVIVDIGLRMLTPRELFTAQGFPLDYVIDRAWHVDPVTGDLREEMLTKEQQIRMCGNSVSPPVAEAIVRANCPDLILAPMKFKKPRRVAARA